MVQNSHIRAVGEAAKKSASPLPVEDDAGHAPAFEETLDLEELAEEDYVAPRRWHWILPSLLIVALATWTAFFAWSIGNEAVAGASRAQWIDWAGAWSLPVILILALWLLAMRSSSREADRFGDVAALLSSESARLEQRLLTVNRELSLAREFLEAETRALDTLGRTATERLSEHAEHLQSLIANNGDQLETIAGVSITARENMEKLRDNLPVIANSAKDVANQIGNAGERASERLDALASGFDRLAESGSASELQVGELRAAIDAALADFEGATQRLGDLAARRFGELSQQGEAFRTELGAHEIEALASLNRRLNDLRKDAEASAALIREGEETALAAWRGQIEGLRERLTAVVAEIVRIDEQALASSNEKLTALVAEAERVDSLLAARDVQFAAKLADRQKSLDASEQAAVARLSERLAKFDADFASRSETQAAHLEAFEGTGERLRAELDRIGEKVENIANMAREAEVNLSQSSIRLDEALEASTGPLGETRVALSGLTDASVRLLELIQGSAKHSREDLPQAISEFERRLAVAEERTEGLRNTLGEARDSGERLGETVGAVESRALATGSSIEAITGRVAETAREQGEHLEDLEARLTAFDSHSRESMETLRDQLAAALEVLETRAKAALAAIEDEQGTRVRNLAASIARQGGEAIDNAFEERLGESIAEFEETAQRAAAASREAAAELRDQLGRVNELTANLESRIAHAREQAQQSTDNDFSRRVALITESLNSNAIDIGKALSTEVTDTAWNAYLRGDRGIFTRRAVRLLDNTELREIAELFDADNDFREHVSRYIHDFEAMLRTLLSTRDGNALGVTVLSSDMGKLYVALAQAIERLRE